MLLVAPDVSHAQARQSLVGTWVMRAEGMEMRVELRADGRYVSAIRDAQKSEKETGTYRVAQGVLEFRAAGGDEVERMRYRFVNADTLAVTDEDGQTMQFVRQGAVAPRQPAPQPTPQPGPAIGPNPMFPVPPTPRPAPQKPQKLPTLVLSRVAEPRERAFTLLIPKGWGVEGGIFRINAITQGPANAIAAKLDLAIKSDRRGTQMIRCLPEMIYCDARGMPAAQMGLIRPGSNYKGMTVYPLMSALQFLQQVAFRHAHPQAQGVRIVEQRALPKLAAAVQQRVQALMPIGLAYDAGLLTVAYQEGGVAYRERLFTMIENWGQAGAGMWVNKETVLLRAPADQFGQIERVFSVVRKSVVMNPQWVIGELRGQITRGQIMIKTEQEIQRIGREICEHRRKTNAEINNDMFLTLTDQEEYVNPYTRQVDVGSNQWKRRWVNESGDVIYTDDGSYDPNTDVNLNRSDYKRTPVRPRFPQ